MGTGAWGPHLAISGSPEANAEPTAAGRQITGEPCAQGRIEDEYRVPEVGAVAGGKRCGQYAPEVGASIYRHRNPREIARRHARVVVVDDDGLAVTAPDHALALCDFRIGLTPRDDIHVVWWRGAKKWAGPLLRRGFRSAASPQPAPLHLHGRRGGRWLARHEGGVAGPRPPKGGGWTGICRLGRQGRTWEAGSDTSASLQKPSNARSAPSDKLP